MVEDRRASTQRALRNLFLVGVLVVVGLTLLLTRYVDPQQTVWVVAAAASLLLTMAILGRSLAAVGPSAWSAVIAAFLLTRSVVFLASGKVYAVRDALTHVVGIPAILVDTGHLPSGDIDPDLQVYRFYPAIHFLQATVHFTTGIPLWEASLLIALVLGLATLGFIGVATRNAYPTVGILAGAAYVIAPLASSPHQALQPMSVATMCLAAFLLLLARPLGSHLEETLFVVVGTLLVASHPYSTAIVGIALFVTVCVLAVRLKQFRFLFPVGAGVALTLAYLGALTRDFDRFAQYLSPPSGTTLAQARPGTGSAGPSPSGITRAATFVETWKFRAPVLLSLLGWGLAWRRPRKALSMQILLGCFGVLYLVALAVAGAFPSRVLTLAAIPLAPFVGYALAKITPWGAVPAVVACALLAVTSIHSAEQFTPWARDGQILPQPLDEPPGVDTMVRYYLSIEGGRLIVTNPIASHPVFDDDVALSVRSFSGLDDPSRAPREYYFYRDVAESNGFAVTRTAGAERGREFHYYPTQGNLDLLAGIDRIADVGTIQLHRN